MRLSKDETAWQSAKSHTEANKLATYCHFYCQPTQRGGVFQMPGLFRGGKFPWSLWGVSTQERVGMFGGLSTRG